MTFHETVLKKLVEYRETHPYFNFIARQRTGAGKRFENGYWFPGNKNYAFVGLVNANGGAKKTKSVGIAISPTKEGFSCDLEIAFSEEKDNLLIEAYQAIVEKISGIKHGGGTNYHYHIGELTVDDFSNLFSFLDKYYGTIIEEFKIKGKDSVLISNEKFGTILDTINRYRDKSDTKYWLYAPGENAEKWNEFYDKGIMALGWDNLGDLKNYSSKPQIVERLQELANSTGSKKNDATANDEFANQMDIGDVVFVKKGRGALLGYGIVASDYMFDNERNEFKHVRRMDWKKEGEWDAGHNLVLKTLTNVSDYPTPDAKYPTYHERLMAIINGNEVSNPKTYTLSYPINTILYGPPGTGKTYNTKNIALKILGYDTENLSREEIKEEYDKKVDEGQVVFTTFHQSMSYEDFIEGIKPETTEGEKLSYPVKAGIFKTICAKAEDSYLDSIKGISEELPFDEAFEKLKEEWEENEQIKFSMKSEGYDFTILGFTERSIQFRKFSGGTGHTLSISTLRDYYYGTRQITNAGVGIYYPGVLEKLKSYKPINNSSGKKLKNYILIIDEINRGNVSAIFGELITLLEPDKRLGESEQITLELPYSKGDSFGVPPNLYIIGTMNTADRSVEALDTALRRRFSFVEMNPNPELLKGFQVDNIKLDEVLQKINERVELLVDKDHTIGHTYFMNLSTAKDLAQAFANKIIPLLQEYFYGDYGKIGLVLGEGFIEKVENKNVEFAAFKYEGQNDFKTPSFRLKPIDENNILSAIALLLGQNKNKED